MIVGIVQGQSLQLDTPVTVSDSVNFITAVFHFSPEWDGMTEKWVHFISGGEGYSLQLQEDRVTADMGLNLPAGEWEVYLHGLEKDDGETLLQRATTETARLYVQDFAGFEGEEFPDGPPSAMDRLRELAEQHAPRHASDGEDPITPEDIGAGRVNPNLLDNWYFANPVNQRGQTAYSGTGYGIDRWKSVHTDSAYTLASGGASFTSKNLRFDQLLEHPEQYVGKQLTFSVLIPENTGTAAFYIAQLASGDHKAVAYEAAGFTGLMSGKFEVPEGFEGVRFFTTSVFTGAVTVAAAKLELGTQQTLAHQDDDGNWVLNEIPDYNEQLLRCQRYYQLFSSADRRPSDRRDFRPELRTDATSSNTGTVTVDGTTYYYASAEL